MFLPEPIKQPMRAAGAVHTTVAPLSRWCASCPVHSVQVTPLSVVVALLVAFHVGSAAPVTPVVIALTRKHRSLLTAGAESWRRIAPTASVVSAAHCVTAV